MATLTLIVPSRTASRQTEPCPGKPSHGKSPHREPTPAESPRTESSQIKGAVVSVFRGIVFGLVFSSWLWLFLLAAALKWVR